jgi:phospholipid/cholesterol/gamma-HCH transport system substrate-binding protein
MNALRYSILGGFFFITMFVLGVLTIYLGEWNPFVETFKYQVYFDNVDSLRPGDSVQVFGVQRGKVDSIAETGEDASRRLVATLIMERELQLREGCSFRITSQSLLGGKRVDVDIGTGPALTSLSDLRGYSEGDVIRELGQLVAENRSNVAVIVESLSQVFGSVASRQASLLSFVLEAPAHEALNDTLSSARNISGKLDTGTGSIAQLINSSETYDSLNRVLTHFDTIVAEIADGDGTIARLIDDPALFDQLSDTFDALRHVAQRIEHGDGLLGWATSEDSDEFSARLDSILLQVDSIAQHVGGGHGVLGRLAMSDDLEQTFDQITRDVGDMTFRLQAMVADVQAGRGVVGYLLADDTARREFEKIVRLVAGALEDAREAAPVSSVASFLFGQF